MRAIEEIKAGQVLSALSNEEYAIVAKSMPYQILISEIDRRFVAGEKLRNSIDNIVNECNE